MTIRRERHSTFLCSAIRISSSVLDPTKSDETCVTGERLESDLSGLIERLDSSTLISGEGKKQKIR